MPIKNPYKNVDWNNDYFITSCSHIHLDDENDFWNAYDNGLRHFAVGNYGTHWNPHDYVDDVPSDVIVSPNTELHGGFSPFYVGITGLGSEFEDKEAEQHHNKNRFDFVDKLYSKLKYPSIGAFALTHPLRTSDYEEPHDAKDFLHYMTEMLDYNPLVALEIYNASSDPFWREDRTGEWSLKLWDLTLATGRQCYGHFNPDHIIKWADNWRGRNILLTKAETEEECLKAYANGHFYGSMLDSDLKFNKIELDEDSKTLTIETTNAHEITIVTDKGKTVIENNETTFNYDDEIFIRVEAQYFDDEPESDIEDGYDMIFSNPIMLRTLDKKPEIEIGTKKKKLLLL